MKILYILPFFQLYITPAQANLSQLVNEFLQNNIEMNRNRISLQLADFDYQTIQRKRPWNLSLSSTHDNNGLDSSSRFTNRSAKTLKNSFSLQKELLWGGHLSMDNTLTSIDNNPSSSTVSLGGGLRKVNEFGQSITYKQALGANFLGRNQYQELLMAKRNLSYSKLSMEDSKEKGLLQFYYAYLSACLNKTLQDLQKKALDRAQKRSGLIKKRVRDGLRQKVDLLQVEMNEMKQREELKNVSINLNNSIETLTYLLHRKVNKSELSVDFIEKSPLASFENLSEDHSNKDDHFPDKNFRIALLKEKQQLQRIKLTKTKYQLIPKLELFTQYSTNRYASEISQAFSQGLLGGARKEIIVGLTLNFPLWFEPQQIEVNQAQINFNLTVMELEKTANNIKVQDISLIRKLSKLKKNIISVEKRKKLARNVLKEYNNLYRLGRRDLDQVISAEESLINTERGHIKYLVDKEKLLAELASLHGDFLDLLTKEK